MPEFNCTACPLHEHRSGEYVIGNGKSGSRIAIIGDVPDIWDAQKGGAFVERSGEMLEAALREAGLSRADVFVSNLVRCHTDNRLQREDAATCFHHLNQEICFVKPRVVVLMGCQTWDMFLGHGCEPSMVFDSASAAPGFEFHGAFGASGFKFVTAPNIFGDFGGLVKSLGMADRLSRGGAAATREFGHSEEQVFNMLAHAAQTAKLFRNEFSFHVMHSDGPVFPRMHGKGVAELKALAWSWVPYEAQAIILNKKTMSERVRFAIRALLTAARYKIGHDCKRGVEVLMAAGLWGGGIAFDTAVADYAQTQKPWRGVLELVAARRPDISHFNSVQNSDNTTLEICAGYADAISSQYQHVYPQIKAEKFKLFEGVLMPHYRECIEIEMHGIRYDVEGAKALGAKYISKLCVLEIDCATAVNRYPHWWGPADMKSAQTPQDFKPLNLSSNDAVAEVLYGEFRAPVLVKTAGGKPSVDAEALEPLRATTPFVRNLLAFRSKLKFLSTYLGLEYPPRHEPVDAGYIDLFASGPTNLVSDFGLSLSGSSPLHCVDTNGILHPEIHVDGTEPGRVVATDPAIQVQANDKAIRDLIIPREGYVFLDADYRALELRIMAIHSRDPELKRIFDNGWDPHSVTASKIFGIAIDLKPDATKQERDDYFRVWNVTYAGQRAAAKKTNFGIPYGQTAYGLARELGCSERDAQQWLTDWDQKAFPVASAWLKANIEIARKAGGIAYGMQRFRALPGFRSDDYSIRSLAERQARNTPLQGEGGDCLSIAIARIHARFRKAFGQDWSQCACIIMEIHDQIVAEVRLDSVEQVKTILQEEMTRTMPFLDASIPLEVEIKVKTKWGGII